MLPMFHRTNATREQNHFHRRLDDFAGEIGQTFQMKSGRTNVGGRYAGIPTLSPLQLQPGRHDYRMGARAWPDGGLAGLWVAAAARPDWPTSGGGGDAGPGASGRAADLGERPGVYR